MNLACCCGKKVIGEVVNCITKQLRNSVFQISAAPPRIKEEGQSAFQARPLNMKRIFIVNSAIS